MSQVSALQPPAIETRYWAAAVIDGVCRLIANHHDLATSKAHQSQGPVFSQHYPASTVIQGSVSISQTCRHRFAFSCGLPRRQRESQRGGGVVSIQEGLRHAGIQRLCYQLIDHQLDTFL
jgi:hypothetical protein